MKFHHNYKMSKKKNFLAFLILFVCIMANKKVYSLNAFELALLGIGAGFVGVQYFDSSLDYDNNYKQKSLILNRFIESKQKNIKSAYFYKLPIQQQLLIINEFNSN